MKKIPYLSQEAVEDAGGYIRKGNEAKLEKGKLANFAVYFSKACERTAITALREANKDTKDYFSNLDAFTIIEGEDEFTIRGLEDIALDRHLFECAKFGEEQKRKFLKQNP